MKALKIFLAFLCCAVIVLMVACQNLKQATQQPTLTASLINVAVNQQCHAQVTAKPEWQGFKHFDEQTKQNMLDRLCGCVVVWHAMHLMR
ncbi:hypothetical protein [Acinetobacter sp. c3-l95]|uniref:hypothetical protein n=1 Tax=Acinetobacter sp. c3-l95 TaxID=3342804 RepID=UPI0035B7A0B2